MPLRQDPPVPGAENGEYPPVPDRVIPTPYGFLWGGVDITRRTHIQRSNGVYRVLGIDAQEHSLDIYISPAGRLRVFRGNRELK